MSRFIPINVDRAKRIAKSLRQELASLGVDVALNVAQATTAKMLGFTDWHELQVVTSPGKPASQYDEACSPAIVAERRDQQIAAIAALGVPYETARRVALETNPTGDPSITRRMGRIELPREDVAKISTIWWTPRRAVAFSDDILFVETEFSSGYRVSKSLVSTFPQLLQAPTGRTEHAWYETGKEDCLLPLACPAAFSDGEINRAKKQMAERYPKLSEALVSGSMRKPREALRPDMIVPRAMQQRYDEYFSVRIRDIDFVVSTNGLGPAILAYGNGQRGASTRGVPLGDSSVLAVPSAPQFGLTFPNEWALCKHGPDQPQVYLMNFERADLLKLCRAFAPAIDYHIITPWAAFSKSAVWNATVAWAMANPSKAEKSGADYFPRWQELALGADIPNDADEWMERYMEQAARAIDTHEQERGVRREQEQHQPMRSSI